MGRPGDQPSPGLHTFMSRPARPVRFTSRQPPRHADSVTPSAHHRHTNARTQKHHCEPRTTKRHHKAEQNLLPHVPQTNTKTTPTASSGFKRKAWDTNVHRPRAGRVCSGDGRRVVHDGVACLWRSRSGPQAPWTQHSALDRPSKRESAEPHPSRACRSQCQRT